jgi:hypothetical protein
MIRRTQIFGERCSGTNYLEILLKTNFEDIEITWDYGWKHFFPINIDKNNHDDCLFIVIFRNPYDWLSSFHNNPYHVDQSLKNLTFSDFIRKEWKCVYNKESATKEDDPNFGKEMMHERNPETGERFKNILEMRNYKVKAFLSLEEEVLNYAKFRYEDLRDNPNILKGLSEEFKLKLKGNNIVNYTKYKTTKQIYQPKEYPPISFVDKFYIRRNLDLRQEKSIGYNPRLIS